MPGAANTTGTSPSSLLPMAVVAIGVLALALAVSGALWRNTTGTIVLQRIVFTSTGGFIGAPNRRERFSFMSAVESSPNGTELRSLTSSSGMRPGFQESNAGETIALYDAADNTIYETTEPAWQRAVNAQFNRNAPKGSHTTSATLHSSYAYASHTPGTMSVYEQELRAGQYRLGRRTTIDGRPALELIPTQRAVRSGPHSEIRQIFDPVYVSPKAFAPIQQVVDTTVPGQRTRTVERWLTYRVFAATSANLWRVSLTARHPHARVVHSATGFLRASDTSARTENVASG